MPRSININDIRIQKILIERDVAGNDIFPPTFTYVLLDEDGKVASDPKVFRGSMTAAQRSALKSYVNGQIAAIKLEEGI